MRTCSFGTLTLYSHVVSLSNSRLFPTRMIQEADGAYNCMLLTKLVDITIFFMINTPIDEDSFM